MTIATTDHRAHSPPRAFTLVEIVIVVAIAGVLASLGMAGMRELVVAERARNNAVKFSTDLRRHRSEAAQRKMHSYVETNVAPGGTLTVRFLAKRTGTGATTPCEFMQTGISDVMSTQTYESINIDITQTNPLTGVTAASSGICFTQHGMPRSTDLLEPRAVDLELANGTRTALSMAIDPTGAMISSDSSASTGIASTSLHPQNLMEDESAPVPPGAFDDPVSPFYETDPGVYVEAGGSGDDGGGGVDPCDPFYGVCPAECIMSVCASPCGACYNPCSDATYASTYPCECDPSLCAVCDPLTTICPCDPVTGICPCDPVTGICP